VTIRTDTLIDKCKGCPFLDIADSLDRVCTFKPNFKVAPKKRHYRKSHVDPDVKRKGDYTMCVFIDWFYEYDKKPGWCRLKKTSITYE